MSCGCQPISPCVQPSCCTPPQLCQPQNYGLAFPSLVGPPGPPGGPGLYVEGYDELRDVNPTSFVAGYVANVGGYETWNDGGGGKFIYDPTSVAADNDGTVIAPNSGPGRWIRESFTKINVQWFGAKGDATNDDTAAIDAAVTYAESLASGNYRPILFFPACAGFKTTSGIVIQDGVDVIMDGCITYSANTGVALTVGTAAHPNVNGEYVLNVIKTTLSNWADGTVGIRFINTYSSTINIVEASQFQEGVQCVGDTAGFVYNNVTIGAIRNNKVGMRLTDGAVSGWCNENNFFGGRFDCSSTTNTTVSRNAVIITSNHGGYQNNNNFYKPSFELSNATLGGGATSVPILIEYGQINAFYNIRQEDSGTLLATMTNESYRNVFELGYGQAVWGTNVVDAGTYKDSVIISRDTRRAKSYDITTVFDSGPLYKLATPYSSDSIMVPRCHFGSSAAAFAYVAASSVTINVDSLGLGTTRAIGVFVATEIHKRFVVRRDFASSSNPGRVIVRAYDAAGAILGSGHVFGSAGYNFTYDAGYFGGAYYSAESTEDIFFVVSSSVKKVAVLVGAPSSGYVPLRSFAVDSIDGGTPTEFAGINDGSLVQVDDGLPRASASPTIFANECPQFIFHSAPASATAMGWAKVFSLATTINGAEGVGQTVITVTDATGVASGDIVTILLDDGSYHHTTVNGAPAGNDVTIANALPSAATNTAFYVARYKAMANLA